MVVVIISIVLVALLVGAYRRPVTPKEDERAKTIGKAIHNTVAVQFGESLAGQGQWEFGPPPAPASYEPVGENVVTLEVAPPETSHAPAVPPPEPPAA
ncbi:MAG: hypothetical protein Q8P41_08825 [Pseudomonadota bacterium]|nr:hypothetical protein [Pseudomonadota bacterium]